MRLVTAGRSEGCPFRDLRPQEPTAQADLPQRVRVWVADADRVLQGPRPSGPHAHVRTASPEPSARTAGTPVFSPSPARVRARAVLRAPGRFGGAGPTRTAVPTGCPRLSGYASGGRGPRLKSPGPAPGRAHLIAAHRAPQGRLRPVGPRAAVDPPRPRPRPGPTPWGASGNPTSAPRRAPGRRTRSRAPDPRKGGSALPIPTGRAPEGRTDEDEQQREAARPGIRPRSPGRASGSATTGHPPGTPTGSPPAASRATVAARKAGQARSRPDGRGRAAARGA